MLFNMKTALTKFRVNDVCSACNIIVTRLSVKKFQMQTYVWNLPYASLL